jgi:predicted metal-dependent hydrolase
MSVFIHTTTDGCAIRLKLRRTARKNIILRVASHCLLDINAPPFVSMKSLHQWLRANEASIKQFWQQAAEISTALPAYIWFRGQTYSYMSVAVITRVHWHARQGFLLPLSTTQLPYVVLRDWLKQCAQTELLSRLQYWAQVMQLRPAAMALSQARTFWGVCRRRTGIRLNWRLIGAPAFVVDYVCIHELCHLRHANHGKAFWAMVAEYTAETVSARLWLKKHGTELFTLDNVS